MPRSLPRVRAERPVYVSVPAAGVGNRVFSRFQPDRRRRHGPAPAAARPGPAARRRRGAAAEERGALGRRLQQGEGARPGAEDVPGQDPGVQHQEQVSVWGVGG